MTLPDNLVIETSIDENGTIVLFDVSDENSIVLFDVTEGAGTGVLPAYQGPYEITPRKVEQELETDNLRMTDNVTILGIPYAEVSNPSGGLTATIGFE